MPPRPLSALAGDRGGMALIEFAYGLPVLLVAGLGGLESANLVVAHMKVSRIASMTADNASRVRTSMDETDVTELFQGAQLTSGTMDIKANGRIIVSQLERNAAGNGQTIRWQRCYGAKRVNSTYGRQGDGRLDATLQGMGPASRQVAAAANTAVMFVEVFYDYTPLIGGGFGGTARTISYTSAYNVRQRTALALTNTTNVTGADANPCT